jgi:O-antigen/teichoic acid export membrane protein
MGSSRFLLKNAAVYSFSNILNAAIPFLLLPILTRVLVPADYGVLAMFNATLGILGAFTGLSVHGAVNVRFVDREEIDYPRYVGTCLFVLLTSTILTLGVVAIFLQPLSDFTAIPPSWLLVAVLISGSNFLIQVRLGIWLMGKKPVAYGAFQICLGLLNMGLSLLFVLALKYGYEGRLLGQALAIGCFAVMAVFSLRLTGWVVFLPKWDYVRESLAFGVPLVPHVIGGFLLAAADRFIINEKLGLEAAGLYMVAVQLGLGMGLITDAFNKAFVPWLYEQLKADNFATKKQIVRGTWVYFGIALVFAGIIALSSYLILYVVAGPVYVSASTALCWLAFGQAFGGMYLMVTNYIFYKRKTKTLAWITLITGFIGVALTYLIVPILGIVGAGIAFTCAMALRFFLTWIVAQKICPMPWFSSFRGNVIVNGR